MIAIWTVVYYMSASDPRIGKMVKIIDRDEVTKKEDILWWLNGYEKHCGMNPYDKLCKEAERKIKKMEKVLDESK